MVSPWFAAIAFSLGLLVYLLPPMLAPLLPTDLRVKVGHFYYGNALKSFRQLAFVRRLLSGYELYPIGVDDEQRLAEVTLSSGMLSDDVKLQFKDPDGRISRMYHKPVAVVPEILPAAVDAELSEIGYWTGQKALNEGLERQTQQGTVVDPYVSVSKGLHIVDPMDVILAISKSVEPEWIETCKRLTEQRFKEYGNDIGMAETLSTLTGFAVGLGGVAAIRYLNQEVMDGAAGGGGPPSAPIPLGQITMPMLDVVTVML